MRRVNPCSPCPLSLVRCTLTGKLCDAAACELCAKCNVMMPTKFASRPSSLPVKTTKSNPSAVGPQPKLTCQGRRHKLWQVLPASESLSDKVAQLDVPQGKHVFAFSCAAGASRSPPQAKLSGLTGPKCTFSFKLCTLYGAVVDAEAA